MVNNSWCKPVDIADDIGVLLLIWNQAFYRYSNFALDYDELEKFLVKNEEALRETRERDISSLTKSDENIVKALFDELLDVLKSNDKRSPVAVAKALHLLAPNFFPLWDDKISKAYGCYWDYSEYASDKYVNFMEKMKRLSHRILRAYAERNKVDEETAKKDLCHKASANLPFTKSVLKIIDEYNYAFTKYWE